MFSIYGALYKQIIFPVYHYLKNDGINQAFIESRKVEELTGEQLVTYQKTKLQKLLKYTYTHVPYYREEMIKVGISSVDDINASTIKSLPLLSKDIIRKRHDNLISNSLKNNRLIKNSTSGSSGEALYFYHDFKSHASRASIVDRNHRWVGVQNGDKEARLWGAQMDVSVSNSLRGRLHSFVSRHLMLSTYTMTEEDMFRYASLLKQFKPKLLTSYSGPLTVFADFCIKNKIEFHSIKGIITSAEMLFPHQREIIENAFGVKIFNRYGSREFGDMAQEDSLHDGLRVNSDRVYIEILNEQGKDCEPGVLGELFITDLDDFGMPFIRYKIGDRAAWSEIQHFYKGMPFPLLKCIEGRSLDVVHAPNGNKLGGTFWTFLFKAKPGIVKFQVRQETLPSIRVSYISDENFKDNYLNYFEDKIKESCGEEMKVEFVQVNSFPQSANGKHRIVLSMLRQS